MIILMYDLARGQRFVESHWRRILPLLRELGYTDVALYAEMLVHLPSVPLHRPYSGLPYEHALTINRLCREHGLGAHWFTNTLGHCETLLVNDHYRALSETPESPFQICPSHPGTREALGALIAGYAALDPSDWLHVGGDEAYHLNHCDRCRARGLSKGELYLDHFQWVIGEVKRHGKRAALWGDMLLHHPEIAERIDKDTLIFDWQYTGGSSQTLRFFRDKGFEVVPCTASIDYSTFHPCLDVLETGLRPFLTAARQAGCRHMCHAVWEMYFGDLWDNQWLSVAAAPEFFTRGEFSPEEFAHRFFGSRAANLMRLAGLIDEPSMVRIARVRKGTERSCDLRRAFLEQRSAFDLHYRFQHRLDGVAATAEDLERARSQNERARTIAAEIQRSATRHQDCLRFLSAPYDLFELFCDRVAVLRKVREASEALHPHRLPSEEGVALLADAVGALSEHIDLTREVADLLQRAADEAGHPAGDAANLRRQIADLDELLGYVRYHRDTYAAGEPVPDHSLWFV